MLQFAQLGRRNTDRGRLAGRAGLAGVAPLLERDARRVQARVVERRGRRRHRFERGAPACLEPRERAVLRVPGTGGVRRGGAPDPPQQSLDATRRDAPGERGERTVATAGERDRQRVQRRRRVRARLRETLLDQRDDHFAVARDGAPAAQAPQPPPRLATRGRPQQLAPHVERSLEPPGGDAQVVDSVRVGALREVLRGRLEALRAAADRLGDAGGVGTGAIDRQHAHGTGDSSGRSSASTRETRSQSSCEMSSTLRVASRVWKPNSRARPSSSPITRRW